MTEKVVCPECKTSSCSYDPKRGEWACRKCGLVIKDKELDQTGGVNQYNKEPKYPVGAIIYGRKPGSYIDRKNLDSMGKEIPPHMRSTIDHARKWHHNSHSQEDRKIITAMNRLHFLLQQVEAIKPAKEEAKKILLKFLKKTSGRVKDFKALNAAIVFLAYKIKKLPKSMEEISKITSIKKKSINHYYTVLVRTLEIKIIPLSLLKYIPGISEKLGIDRKSQILAGQLLEKTRKSIINGKNPIGWVIAALYLACIQNDKKISQKSLSKAGRVSEVTLRSRCKELSF